MVYTSLRGLIQITAHEKETIKVKEYLQRPDLFIKKIIDFSRNKRASVDALQKKLLKNQKERYR